MTAPSREDVRIFLVAELSERSASRGGAFDSEEITDDRDLLLSGLIDSLGFLELAVALNEFCGFELDFDELDPEQMTVVGPLCDFVASQAAARRS